MSEPEWFAPKRYGFGAVPITWQGWALVCGYVAILVGARFVLRDTLAGYLSVAAMVTVVFIVVSARTTRGGWRWRWGEEE